MSQSLNNHFFLCCDWGTSSFRLRLVASQDYEIKGEFTSSSGVATVFKEWEKQNVQNRSDFYTAFLKHNIHELANVLAVNLDNTPLIVSGMASSSLGMEELPYALLPFDIDGKNASIKTFHNFNGIAPLMLISGVKSIDDVMRGEEAQLIGLIKLNEISIEESLNLVFVFPGTHSKHIFVQNGFIADFKTYMTGELFNIVKKHSILKDSVLSELTSQMTDQSEIEAFLRGIEVSGRSSVLHNLFTVRTNQLFDKFSKNENLYYLSGLLIGTEVRELKQKEFDNLFVCCGKNLFECYKLAFNTIFPKGKITFLEPEMIDKATIAGQIELFNLKHNSLNE
ncbi:2-dehydro-3-deoxygalactonokinase [Daejeonella sp.]|uniref:2-dehydro-3-deoxygalactonokinase n=1 Tax=Daejeonella sp. TaxID=2805397 RepID=UPI0037835D48